MTFCHISFFLEHFFHTNLLYIYTANLDLRDISQGCLENVVVDIKKMVLIIFFALAISNFAFHRNKAHLDLIKRKGEVRE